MRKSRSKKSPAEPVELRIESLAFGGEGVARREGKVCFVAGALPGELVSALPMQSRPQWDRLRLLEVREASPQRRPPLCSHSRLCGGCSLQCFDYDAQLAAKASQVRELLSRIGETTVPEPEPPVPAPSLRAYRNKMEWSFAARPWHADGPPEEFVGPALGLHVPGRFDAVFDVEDCALPSERSLQALELTRAFAREERLSVYRNDTDAGLLRHLVVREGLRTGEVLAALVVREEEPRLRIWAERLQAGVDGLVGAVLIVNGSRASIARGDREVLLAGRSTFRERLLDLEFELQAQSFFQTNTLAAERLLQVIQDFTAGAGGRLLDLYCGAGTIGLALARRFESLLGVEQSAGAVRDAESNARRNGIANAQFVAQDAEAWVDDPDARPGRFDLVVVDPPRAGLHPRALQGMLALEAPVIVYVSCNPSTLARDVKTMAAAGYGATRLRVVDLFPHTAHVESVVRFELGARTA